MHILVATDGTLDVEKAAEAVGRWYSEGDQVTVFTAMNIPTDVLKGLGNSGIKEASHIALEAGQGFTAGDRAAEQLAKPVSTKPSSDSPVLKALASSAEIRTKPVKAALEERDITAATSWITTNNKTARSIMQALEQHGSELLVIGSHGRGRFEGLLGSTGTKLVRHAPTTVLVIRNAAE